MARPILKRASLERAAISVIARQGLHATTIQHIADAAQVSPGLLYRYWKSRDDLAADVYRQHYCRLVAQFAELLRGVRDPFERLSVLVRAFLEFAEQQPVLLRFFLMCQHDLHRVVPPERGIRYLLGRIMREGIAAGRFRPIDPDLASQLTLGIALQPVVGSTYGHLSTPIIEHFPAMIAALERTLLLAAPGAPLSAAGDASTIAKPRTPGRARGGGARRSAARSTRQPRA